MPLLDNQHAEILEYINALEEDYACLKDHEMSNGMCNEAMLSVIKRNLPPKFRSYCKENEAKEADGLYVERITKLFEKLERQKEQLRDVISVEKSEKHVVVNAVVGTTQGAAPTAAPRAKQTSQPNGWCLSQTAAPAHARHVCMPFPTHRMYPDC